MRSFLLASAALCMTCAFIGCDAPVEPVKPVTPVVEKPADKDKMEPAPTPVEKPIEKPVEAPK
jgi:hypothetical protein